MVKVLKMRLRVRDGRTVEAKVRRARHGHVSVETWGGENELSLQYMTMQNGQIDVAAVEASVDSPLKTRVFTSIRNGSLFEVMGQKNDVGNFLPRESYEVMSRSAIRRALEWSFKKKVPARPGLDPRLDDESFDRLARAVESRLFAD